MAGCESFNPQLEVDSFESLQMRIGEQNPKWSDGEVKKQALVVFNTKMFPQQIWSYFAEARGDEVIQVDQKWENIGGRLVDEHYGAFQKMIDNASSEEERESLINFEKEAVESEAGDEIWILDKSALDIGGGIKYMDIYEKDIDGSIKHSKRVDLADGGEDLTIEEAERKVKEMKMEEGMEVESEWVENMGREMPELVYESRWSDMNMLGEVQESRVMPWIENNEEKSVMFDEVIVEEAGQLKEEQGSRKTEKEVIESAGIQESAKALEKTEKIQEVEEVREVYKVEEMKTEEGIIKNKTDKPVVAMEDKKEFKKKVERVERIEKVEKVKVEKMGVKEERLKEEKQESLSEEKITESAGMVGEVKEKRMVVIEVINRERNKTIEQNTEDETEEAPIWKPELATVMEKDIPELKWQSVVVENLNGSLVSAGLRLEIEMIERAEMWFSRSNWIEFNDLNQRLGVVAAMLFLIVNTSLDQRAKLKIEIGESSLIGWGSGGRQKVIY